MVFAINLPGLLQFGLEDISHRTIRPLFGKGYLFIRLNDLREIYEKLDNVFNYLYAEVEK